MSCTASIGEIWVGMGRPYVMFRSSARNLPNSDNMSLANCGVSDVRAWNSHSSAASSVALIAFAKNERPKGVDVIEIWLFFRLPTVIVPRDYQNAGERGGKDFWTRNARMFV